MARDGARWCDRVRRFREARGLSRMRLAVMLGCVTETVGLWETKEGWEPVKETRYIRRFRQLEEAGEG